MQHLINFWPLNMTITFWDEDLVRSLKLEGHVELFFSPVKKCVGWYDGQEYHRCPNKAINTKRCPTCSSMDISKIYTRLDYRGYEEEYKEMRQMEFSLYIASFGNLLKGGVTRTSRVLERAQEQGADYFCEIARVRGADLAYSLEQYIQNAYNLRNFVTTNQKIHMIKNKNKKYIEEIVYKIDKDPVLKDFLTNLDILEFNYSIPKEFKLSNHINGEILGTKGQILFFENNNENFAVNMSLKKGYEFKLLAHNNKILLKD